MDLKTIENMIKEGVEENLHLDYKSADSLGKTDGKKKELAKDISAFANSDGGTIIYGVKEFDNPEKRHLPEKIDPIIRTEISKEYVEQVINSNISPKIHGIKINPISIDAVENGVLYVIIIPKSDTAHQASDKRYYRRYNFESIAMEDWEIRDIFNRKNKTNVELSFEPDLPMDFIMQGIEKARTFNIRFDVWAKNNGNIIVKELECFFSGNPDASRTIIEPSTVANSRFEFVLTNRTERKIEANGNEYIISKESNSILPNTSRNIGRIELLSDFILKDFELSVQICTEDNSRFIKFKGKEILKK